MTTEKIDTFVATPTLMIGLVGRASSHGVREKSLLETNQNVLPAGWLSGA